MVTHLLVKKKMISTAKKKWYRPRHGINRQYCTISQNLFWPPFLNITFFSFKLYFKNINVFMFFFPTLSQISLIFFFFQNLVTWLFCETSIRFLAAILKRNMFWLFFFLIYNYLRCIHIWCKFRTAIPTGKYSKEGGSTWTLVSEK